ncbi:MAG: NAD(P)/FAD-dependent oxidoreductase [Deltaproteobacteria bacterium]|nr:MAG: NAD(P)/FAD-dependent oxidoreductase [Deltaproteobacteria bacterium]
MQYVIIGASAAGMAAAEAIRKLDSQGSIIVLSEEQDMPYFRPMLPFMISGKKKFPEMILIGQGPYQGANIDVRINSRVEALNTAGQKVYIKNGEELPYDKLLIATGSLPNIPSDIGGLESEGVFVLRTIADARAITHRAETVRHAVMLGGGLLNLKAAFALLERGLDVTLIVKSPDVLSKLMEPDDTVLIRNALNKAGMKLMTGSSVTRILSDSTGVIGVLLDNGGEIPCQMVCIGKGIRANIEFLDKSGILVDQGVVVDKFTRSNIQNVFAAGDVAVTFDQITGERIVTGLWTNAAEMGNCAGRNMAGRPSIYSGTFGILNATQVADEPFVSMGIVHTKGADYETHIAATPKTYRKLVFTPDGTRLVGALFIGDISKAGLYRYIIRERMTIKDIKSEIVNHRLHYGHFLR